MYASTAEHKEGGLGSVAASGLVLLSAVKGSMVEGFVFTTLPSRPFPGCSPVGSVATADVHGYPVASVWCPSKAAGLGGSDARSGPLAARRAFASSLI